MDKRRIRRAHTSEHDAIYRMGFDTWGDDSGMESYLDVCRSSQKYARGRWFVLCVGAELVSSALVHDFPAWGSQVVRGIGSLATFPHERGKGLGGELLVQLTSFLAEEEGASIVFLYSDIDKRFYEKRGYRPLDVCHQQHAGSVVMAWLRPEVGVHTLYRRGRRSNPVILLNLRTPPDKLTRQTAFGSHSPCRRALGRKRHRRRLDRGYSPCCT